IHLPWRLHSFTIGGISGNREIRSVGHRYRDPAPTLRRDAEGLARALPGAPRGGRAHLRPTLRAYVGVLSRGIGNVVPRAEHDGVPNPTHQTARYSAND